MIAAQNELSRAKKRIEELEELVKQYQQEKEKEQMDKWGDNFDRGL